jgi:hypothetical protein
MKYLILFIFFLSAFIVNMQAQKYTVKSDSIKYISLVKMDFDKLQNKPVGYFFKKFPFKYKGYTFSYVKPGFIKYLIFMYSDSLSINIAVKDLGQKEPLNFNYKFDINVFKSKKIEWVCMKYAGECIKGCKKEDCKY